jgi:hypothetical protein
VGLEEVHQPEDLGGITRQAREIVGQEHVEGRGAAQRGQQPTIGRAMLDADAREGFIDIPSVPGRGACSSAV